LYKTCSFGTNYGFPGANECLNQQHILEEFLKNIPLECILMPLFHFARYAAEPEIFFGKTCINSLLFAFVVFMICAISVYVYLRQGGYVFARVCLSVC